MQKKKDTSVSGSDQLIFSGKKLTEKQQMLLLKLLQDDPACTTREIIEKAKQSGEDFNITLRHLNRLRKKWGYSVPKGRPLTHKNSN